MAAELRFKSNSPGFSLQPEAASRGERGKWAGSWELSEFSGPHGGIPGLGVSIGPTFLEADAVAPPRPGGQCRQRKFLEFVSDGRCHRLISHNPGASVNPGTLQTL